MLSALDTGFDALLIADTCCVRLGQRAIKCNACAIKRSQPTQLAVERPESCWRRQPRPGSSDARVLAMESADCSGLRRPQLYMHM